MKIMALKWNMKFPQPSECKGILKNDKLHLLLKLCRENFSLNVGLDPK